MRAAIVFVLLLVTIDAAAAETRDIHAECVERCRRDGFWSCGSDCDEVRRLHCTCNGEKVVSATLESRAHDTCVRRCGWTAITAGTICDKDFERSQCTGATAAAIHACNVGVRETQTQCRAMAEDVKALCALDCDRTTALYDEVWPAPGASPSPATSPAVCTGGYTSRALGPLAPTQLPEDLGAADSSTP